MQSSGLRHQLMLMLTLMSMLMLTLTLTLMLTLRGAQFATIHAAEL